MVSQSMPRQANHANNFDSLRLIFAVLVIFSHSFPLTRGSNATEPLSVLTGGQITFGNISVWAFFVISGFLITQSWQRSPKVWKFLKRRINRIYPGYAVAAFLTAIVVVPIATEPGTFFPVTLQSFFFNTLRLHQFAIPPVFMHNPMQTALNGSLWSVPYEFWCYLGVLAFGLTGLLRKKYVVVTLFFLAIGFHLYLDVSGVKLFGGILGQIFGYPPYWAAVLPFYLAGAIFQIYGGYPLLRRPWIIAAGVVLVVSDFVPHGLVVTVPTCGAYLLMALAYLPWLHPLNLGRFGDFSYGTYLYAFPIQQLLVQRAHGQITPLQLFAEAAPITLVVGALSWHLVEKHFLQRTSLLKHEGIATTALDGPVTQTPKIRQVRGDSPRTSLVAQPPNANSEGEPYVAVEL